MTYPMSSRDGFLSELAALLASHHLDIETCTHEHALALYLGRCLDAYHYAVQARERRKKVAKRDDYGSEQPQARAAAVPTLP